MKSKIEIYNGSTLIYTLDGSQQYKLYNGVNYSKNINASTDLQLGQVASAQVTFTTDCPSIQKTHTFKYYTWQTELYNGTDPVDSTWRLIGLFYVTDIDKDVNFYTITGYDCICELDKDISEWLKDECTATTITSLYQQVCAKCGLTSGTTNFWVNTNVPVDPKDIYSPGITARTVMGYIAEATASFVYTRDDNKVHCFTYLPTSSPDRVAPAAVKSTLTTSDYSYLNMAREPAPQVTNIAVNTINGTYQTNAGVNAVTMQFIYNPLLYKKSTSQLNTYIKQPYNYTTKNGGVKDTVANIGSYYPCKFKCFSDYRLRCGDIITVNDGIDDRTVLIMSMKLTESGCEFECFGQPEREPFVMQNTDRITNLEANKFNIDEWTESATDKQFNSALMVNDLLIPNGLGYEGNANNTSLLAVIQYILNKLRVVEINMSVASSGLGHTYTTEYGTDWTPNVSSGAGVTCNLVNNVYVITCPLDTTTRTDIPANGTVTFTQGTITVTINCHCYTGVGTVCASPSESNFFDMWYPGAGQYYNREMMSKVYIDSVSSANKIYDDSNAFTPYDENYYLWRDYWGGDNGEQFTIGFKQPGLYIWDVYDRTQEAQCARWNFLVQ